MKKLFTLLTLFLIMFSVTTLAENYVVTNVNDDGPGSLRQAIIDANNHSGPDIILFNISGTGPFIIVLNSQLPFISDELIIDGFSQEGSSPATENSPAVYMVVLDGSIGIEHGLDLYCTNSIVKGIKFQKFGSALEIGGANNIVEGNYITGCLYDAIFISGDNNTFGGNTPAQRNVVFDNHNGIAIAGGSDYNVVTGNYVGVDESGEIGEPLDPYEPGADGIIVTGDYNQIGGTNPGDGNVIGGYYTGAGIHIASWEEDTPENNVIQGNFVGTNKSGTLRINNWHGILLMNANNNFIGGTEEGAGNTISGNEASGIIIDGDNLSTGNIISGNKIGVAADGLTPLPNRGGGIYIEKGFNTVIGGLEEGAGNIISNNLWVGIEIARGYGNSVLGNSIYNNNELWGHPGLGIDIGILGVDEEGNELIQDGVNSNDPGDLDNGTNGMMNFPVITYAIVANEKLVVKGEMDTKNPEECLIQIYANVSTGALDPSGYGEGETFLGSTMAQKNGKFTAMLESDGLTNGSFISATATDANGNTSEFCESFEVKVLSLKSGNIADLETFESDHFKANIYPNPVTDLLHVDINLDQDSYTRIIVYDITGKIVSNINENYLAKGDYTYVWNCTNGVSEVRPGTYIVKIESNKQSIVKKIHKVE